MSIESAKTKTLGEELVQATEELVNDLKTGRKLTQRTAALIRKPKPMTPRAIAALRTRKFRVSQPLFARVLNVSPQTVKAWEQGSKKPCGAALRLLRLAEHDPKTLENLLEPVKQQT